jgi:hypothetical protein
VTICAKEDSIVRVSRVNLRRGKTHTSDTTRTIKEEKTMSVLYSNLYALSQVNLLPILKLLELKYVKKKRVTSRRGAVVN